jgi:hypothetical protein
VRLQQRKRTWDPDSNAWSSVDASAADAGWADAVDASTDTPVAVHLSAEEVSAGILASYADDDATNDGAAYTFAQRTVQPPSGDGAFEERFEYRAVVTSVDGTPDVAHANARFLSADESSRTQTFAVDSDDTSAHVADYTVTVSTEPTLRAEGDAPESSAAVVEERVIAIAGKSVPKPADPPASDEPAPADGEATEKGSEGTEKSGEPAAEDDGPADKGAQKPAPDLVQDPAQEGGLGKQEEVPGDPAPAPTKTEPGTKTEPAEKGDNTQPAEGRTGDPAAPVVDGGKADDGGKVVTTPAPVPDATGTDQGEDKPKDENPSPPCRNSR